MTEIVYNGKENKLRGKRNDIAIWSVPIRQDICWISEEDYLRCISPEKQVKKVHDMARTLAGRRCSVGLRWLWRMTI